MAPTRPFLGLNQTQIRGGFCIFVLATSLGYLGYGPDFGRVDRTAEASPPTTPQVGQQGRIASAAQRQLSGRIPLIIAKITQQVGS